MRIARNPAVLAAILALSVAVSGCLGGPAPVPKVKVTVLTDTEVSAQPNWTVGWAVEVFESTGDNLTGTLTTDAPAAWNARFLNASVLIEKANGRKTTFLFADIPADQANGTYAFTVHAAVGADSASAPASVKVGRPLQNLLHNGTAVKMDYVGLLADNRVFDTSMWAVANSSGLDKWPDFKNSSAVRTQADYTPLSLTLGNHQVIQGWELGLQGMALGQGKALIIAPELAYGHFINQSVNLTNDVPIYNESTMAAFKLVYGTDPVEDAEYRDPTFGWTVQVVSVDNSTGVCVLKNMPAEGGNYTPYGVNATATGISSLTGTFRLAYTPALHQAATDIARDQGEVVDVNGTAFTIRYQTEHRQTLAPYTLEFLVFVRSATG